MPSVTARKIFLGGGVSLLVVIVGFGIFCYHVVTKSFPQTEGTVSGADVSSPVKIYRDPYGIPHIVASNEDDAWFAVGYAQAQERLFQMDIQRRAGAGRLAEIFGSRAIPYDALFRTVGIERVAKRIEAAMRPGVRRALEDYSRGVNAYIERNLHRLPVEFDMLDYKPYLWTPLHSIIVSRMMAWELNLGWWNDITLQDAIDKVGMKDALEMFPQYPAAAPTVMGDERIAGNPPMRQGNAAAANGMRALMPIMHRFASLDSSFQDFLGCSHVQSGSNAWAVSSQRSATGKPVLCNDPHLIITVPSPWYQVHIHAGSLNVAGYAVPGDPFVVIGRNGAIAWGETNAMLDDCDFVVEHVDSTDATRYFSRGAYRQMKIVLDTIHVKDTEDVVLKVYETADGPVISAVHPFDFPARLFEMDSLRKNAASILSRAAIAMHWTGGDVSDENLAFWQIDRARNFNEFLEGVKTFGCPAQNFVYADTAGNIGYALGGNIPLRAAPIPDESVPVSALQPEEIWDSYAPFAKHPLLKNPRSGFIASANNKISSHMDFYFTNLWEPPSRIERIDELLQSQPRLGVADMKKIQNDYVSPYASDMTRYILAAFPDSAAQQPLVKQALEYLANWNGSMDKEEIAASVFNVWMETMIGNMFEPRLGEPVYEEYVNVQSLPQRALAALMNAPNSDWFDDPRTPQRETRDGAIRKSMYEALQYLTARFNSTEMKRWQWGEMHPMVFKHLLGKVKPLDKIFNIGPFPAGGCLTTINNAQFSLIHPYESTLGPSMRMIVDLSSPDMLGVLASGESGQPFSKHYDDQTGLWRNGGYVDITLDIEKIPQPGWHELVLER